MIGGHMHLRTKCGKDRPWKTHRESTTYINAARVPRIFSTSDDVYRHHVSVTIDSNGIQAEEVLVPQYG